MQLNLEQVATHLQKIRADHGDEHYHTALKGLFRDLILKEGGSQYMASLLEKLEERSLNVDDMRRELLNPMVDSLRASGFNTGDIEAAMGGGKGFNPAAGAAASEQVIERAIQQGMPNCKTKAHFQLVMQASEALRVYLDAAFGFDRETASKAREGLNKLLDLAPQIATVAEKLEEHPEATTNRDFVDPPPDPSREAAIQQALLAALATQKTSEELVTWYSSTKETMDQIKSQRLRNELFDAIRVKKADLREREAN
jgi:Zn-dependent oligopeptidase